MERRCYTKLDYDPNIRDCNFQQLNGDTKHDTVVIGRRIREREKQRLEASCCPDCGSPIEYILQRGRIDYILPCNHSFVVDPKIMHINNERMLNGIRQNQRSVSNEETNSDGYNDIG